mgnify:CR=1 FL=1
MGFIEIGLRTGIPDFYKYLDLFGATSVTGVDLPGEASGRIADRKWKRAYYESQKDYYCDLAAKPQRKGTSDFVYKFANEFCSSDIITRPGTRNEV